MTKSKQLLLVYYYNQHSSRDAGPLLTALKSEINDPRIAIIGILREGPNELVQMPLLPSMDLTSEEEIDEEEEDFQKIVDEKMEKIGYRSGKSNTLSPDNEEDVEDLEDEDLEFDNLLLESENQKTANEAMYKQLVGRPL